MFHSLHLAVAVDLETIKDFRIPYGMVIVITKTVKFLIIVTYIISLHIWQRTLASFW